MLLFGADIFLIFFVVWSGITTFWSYQNMKSVVAEIGSARVVGADVKDRNTPKPAITASVESVKQESNYVYLITVSNQNAFWSSPSFSLHLSSGDNVSASRQSFLLPNEKRLVILTGDLGTTPTVSYDSFSWERTPPLSIPNIQIGTMQAQHSFVTVTKQGVRRMVSQITSTVRNQSMYRVQTMKIIAVVRNGAQLVGVQQVFIDDLRANEERPVTIEFVEMLPAFTTIELATEIDALDPDTLQVDI